ncbi:MAG: hypothetical protein PVI18_10105, partial [Desulfobacterales bacterium]
LGDWLTAIDDLENKLDKKNEDINELNVILKRKDNLIKISNRRVDSLDKKNSEQKSIIQSYENKLKDSENKFRDSENKLRNSDKSIVKLNNKIKEQNSTITNYKNELKGKENEIIELNKNIKKLSEEQVKYNDIFVQQTIKLEIPKGNDNSKPVKAIGEVIIILTNVREKSLKTNFTYNIQNTMYEAEDVPQDTIAGRSIGNYLYLFEVIESNSLTPETATIRVIRVLVKR